MDLEGRSLIVTGAGRGIGLVTARTLLDRGARVTICATSEESTDSGLDSLRGAGDVVGLTADVGTLEGARAVVEKAVAEFGALDGLFANAGFYDEGELETFDPARWDDVLRANLTSCFLTTQAAIPHLRRAKGAIITMSSFNGVAGIPGHVSAYGAAKAGVINLTKSLALDLAPEVRVNCIAPGYVSTEKLLAREDAEELVEMLGQATPVGRIGRGEEIAHAVVFAFENDFLNGATITIDGGRCANA